MKREVPLRRARPAHRSLTLILTRRCNLRCGFCPQDFRNEDMPWKVLHTALARIAPRLQPRTVRFFGGEPLLRWALLRRALEELPVEAGGGYEIATNGTLIDDDVCGFLGKRPDVETVLSRWVPAAARLPRVSMNFLIRPGESAEATLERFAGMVRVGVKAFNFLPAYFVPWRPHALAELARALQGLRRMIDELSAHGRPVRVKNLEAHGSIPLCNDGVTVDCDGRLYASNLFLFAGARRHCRPLLLGRLEDRALHPVFPDAATAGRVLEKCFSRTILSQARLVDSRLTEFVRGLGGRHA